MAQNMSKKTFLVTWKLVSYERFIVVGNVGVYKALRKSDLENDPQIMRRAQLLALPYIPDYAAEKSLSSNCSILLAANQIPDRSTPYPDIDATLVLDAENEEEAGEMIDAVNEIYMTCGNGMINKLGMNPNDVLHRFKQRHADGLTTMQAIDAVIKDIRWYSNAIDTIEALREDDRDR